MIKGRFDFEIAPQFVDFQHKVKLSSLVDLILTASGYNADANGFGIRDLNEKGATWVLTRFSLEMSRYPREYEKIQIHTWVEEVHTLNTIRNYRLFDTSGNVIGNSTSVWVMLNIERRRPMELVQLKGIHSYATLEESGIERTMKLNEVGGAPVDSFLVKYSDIDINQHVNTVRYLDWMVNTFSLEEHKKSKVKRLDVNFMSEILFGEHIEVFKEEVEEKEFRMELKANGRTACRGRLVF